jgi:PHD/YefM family antitoxin component YafN of YafNO toxin-antitoxin module
LHLALQPRDLLVAGIGRGSPGGTGEQDLESMEATLELLADPEEQDRLRAAEADVVAGEVLDERAVRDLVSRRDLR